MLGGTNFGPVAYGADLALWLVCRSSTRVSVTPTGTPTYKIYDENGTLVASGSFSSSDVDSQTGFRNASVTIGSGFARGKTYFVIMYYVYSAVTYTETGTFTVV